jgi:hypothetical protein
MKSGRWQLIAAGAFMVIWIVFLVFMAVDV